MAASSGDSPNGASDGRRTEGRGSFGRGDPAVSTGPRAVRGARHRTGVVVALPVDPTRHRPYGGRGLLRDLGSPRSDLLCDLGLGSRDGGPNHQWPADRRVGSRLGPRSLRSSDVGARAAGRGERRGSRARWRTPNLVSDRRDGGMWPRRCSGPDSHLASDGAGMWLVHRDLRTRALLHDGHVLGDATRWPNADVSWRLAGICRSRPVIRAAVHPWASHAAEQHGSKLDPNPKQPGEASRIDASRCSRAWQRETHCASLSSPWTHQAAGSAHQRRAPNGF
jgi:hypothetical protein